MKLWAAILVPTALLSVPAAGVDVELPAGVRIDTVALIWGAAAVVLGLRELHKAVGKLSAATEVIVQRLNQHDVQLARVEERLDRVDA